MDKNPFKLNNLLKNQSSIQKFIINLSTDNSSSESDNEIEPNQQQHSTGSTTVQPNSSDGQGLTTNQASSLTREPDRNVAYKIHTSTIKSTLDRKRQVNSLKIRLQETDQHYNRLKKLINKKNLNVQQMKAKIVQNQLMLRKQQSEVKKLYISYLNASKEMKDNLKQIASLNGSLSVMQKGVDSDKKMMSVLETNSKNLEKLIDINLKELGSDGLNLNEQVGNQETSNDNQDGDSMSLASSDEQFVNLILEHNDTSVNRQDSLFVQQPIALLDEPSVVKTSDVQKTTNQQGKPIPSIISATANRQLDETSISKIIDLKLDYSRRSTIDKNLIKIPTKITNRKKENKPGIQSPTIKKKPINKKKNALLRKMLMIEERNEKGTF